MRTATRANSHWDFFVFLVMQTATTKNGKEDIVDCKVIHTATAEKDQVRVCLFMLRLIALSGLRS